MVRRYLRRKSRKYELLNFTYRNNVASIANTYQYLTHSTNDTSYNYLTVCPEGTYAGVRKVKNFVISLSCSPRYIDTTVLGRYMLFYLPQRSNTSGQESFADQSSGGDMAQIYEPNQNIIATGCFSDVVPVRVRTSLARNLMNGDKIGLMIQFVAYLRTEDGTVPQTPPTIYTTFNINVQYALCYN